MHSFLRKSITLLLLINPILIYYDMFGISVSTINTIIIFLFILILTISKKIINRNTYQTFAIFSLLMLLAIFQIIFIEFYSPTINSSGIIILILSFITFILLHNDIVCKEEVFKYYSGITYFTSILVIIQYLVYYFTNYKINMSIPFLIIKTEYIGSFDRIISAFPGGIGFRASGIFNEPAHFAQYLIPLLVIQIFGERKRLMSTIILIVSLLMSFSGVGIVLLFINLAIKFYRKTKNNVILKMLFILSGIIIVYYILSIPRIWSYVDLLFIGNNSYNSKADYRIYRGINFFLELPIPYKLFGIGYKNGLTTSLYFNLYGDFVYGSTLFEFFSGFSQISIYFGLIGIMIFTIYILYLNKYMSFIGKMLLLNFVLITVADSIFFDPKWMFYVVILMAFIPQYKQLEYRKVKEKNG